MPSSRLAAALVVAVWGCSHSAARPPLPAASAPATASTPAWRGAARSVPSARAAPSAVELDPTEAITPRELASIPDPVPGGSGGGAIESPAPRDSEAAIHDPATGAPAETRVSQTGSSAEGAGLATPRAGSGDERRWIWRVQLFASPDLAQADRVAKETSSRFGVPSVIEFEGSLYKVRLGSFASEAQAQSLRERAVREGFPGAFRMRSLSP